METSVTRYLSRHGYAQWQPRVALFDMDGVLYDSMPYHARAWHSSMAHYGVEMSEAEAYAFEGMRGFETIKIVAGRQWGREVSDAEATEMYALKSAHYAAFPTAGLIPGVHRLQEAMVEAGLRVGVVTGSGQHSLLERIQRDFHGLIDPAIFVTALNISHGKPAPDPYLRGMEEAGSEPWQTMVVENAPLGVRAGVAAGAFTVAVNTGPLPDEALADEGADLVLHSMDELRRLLPALLTPNI